MNHPHHPGMALGPLPIGMLANGSGTPVGIGIRLPIMTASLPPMVHQAPPQSANPAANGQPQPHMLVSVSPDSSEDFRLNSGPMSSSSSSTTMHQGHGVPHPHSNGNAAMQHWGALLQQPGMAGMLMNPMMGMNGGTCVGMMGAPPSNHVGNMGDPNMAYGHGMHMSSGCSSVSGPRPIPLPISSQQLLDMSQQPSHTSITTISPSCNGNSSPSNPLIHHHVQSGIVNGSLPSPICSTTQQPQPQQNEMMLPVKEIIHCKTCTLFPPNPSAPPPTTREKPPGCRTVFVGGLPENGNEELVREIFGRCGEITTIRMSKKNFCHIRFELESYIENAIYLSGYRVRIGSNSDAANIGRLHVDYAQARDDLYEWECRQRQLLREQRHRERLEQERLLPPSPPPVVHFSDHEAVNLAEKLKGDESFMKGVQVLMTWLERGDCSKRTANTFYSMIQSTNSHIRRLLTEKSQFEDELQRAKELAQQRMQGLIVQFSQIEKVFVAACHKKVWDHFTKAQRKNIDIWKKQASEIKNMQLEEALNERNDEEMDFSESDCEDNDGPTRGKRLRLDNEESKTLKEENDDLRCQLEAFKHEVDLIKADLKTEVEQKDQQIRELQEQLTRYRRSPVVISSPTQSDMEPSKSVEQNNDDSNGNESPKISTSASSAIYVSTSSSNNAQINNRKSNRTAKEVEYNLVEKCDSTQQLLMPFAVCVNPNSSSSPTNTVPASHESSTSISCSRDSSPITNGVNTGDAVHQSNAHSQLSRQYSPNSSTISITEREARLLGIISTFLHVHPFGASLDYIWSYAQKIIPGIYPIQIEALMFKFSGLFRQELTGIGATLERKWIFIGFSNPSATSSTQSNSISNKNFVATSNGSGSAQSE